MQPAVVIHLSVSHSFDCASCTVAIAKKLLFVRLLDDEIGGRDTISDKFRFDRRQNDTTEVLVRILQVIQMSKSANGKQTDDSFLTKETVINKLGLSYCSYRELASQLSKKLTTEISFAIFLFLSYCGKEVPLICHSSL